MKRTLILGLIVGACALDLIAGDAARGFNADAVIPAQRRLQSLEGGKRMLGERETTWKQNTESLPDPFFRDSSLKEETDVPVEATDDQTSDKSDLDVLHGVASQIQPTGTLEVGEGRYLLVGGKRLKVGDEIPLVFEGLIYRVTISSVKRNSYTLRLNNEELRREFK